MLASCAPTKILLIEDHPIVRAGVMPYIESIVDNAVVIVAGTLDIAIDTLANESELSLVIVDLNLPDGNGLDVLKHIRESDNLIPAVIMSATDDIDTMKMAMRQGAKGFIPKDIDPDLMVHALRLIHAGGVYVPEQFIKNILQPPNFNQSESNYKGLTNRQIEVLRLLIDGCSNKEIASKIECAESTVKAHVTAILKSLGVANRSKAVEAAKDWQWVKEPEGPAERSNQ